MEKTLLFNFTASQKQAERHKSWTSHFELLKAGKSVKFYFNTRESFVVSVCTFYKNKDLPYCHCNFVSL